MAIHIRTTYVEGSVQEIRMSRPSDFHAHFRRGPIMRAVAPEILRHVRYALAMPNNGPICTIEEAHAYHDELAHLARGLDHHVKILMTLYHTAHITPTVIQQIARSPEIYAIKHYPPHKGATTGSGHGISLEDTNPDVFEAMIEHNIPLLGHFESVYDKNGRELRPEDREAYFVEHHLYPFRDRFPDLRICFEHASTKEAVEFIKEDTSGHRVMTITPQHSFLNNNYFERSWGNHLKCMPIVKSPEHQEAIIAFMTSGDRRVIAGSDTAPHLSRMKNKPFDECASGCWLPHAIAIYASVFIRAGCMGLPFLRFMSLNGPDWWGLPRPEDHITIVAERRRDIPAPTPVPEDHDIIIPLGWTDRGDPLKIGYRT